MVTKTGIRSPFHTQPHAHTHSDTHTRNPPIERLSGQVILWLNIVRIQCSPIGLAGYSINLCSSVRCSRAKGCDASFPFSHSCVVFTFLSFIFWLSSFLSSTVALGRIYAILLCTTIVKSCCCMSKRILIWYFTYSLMQCWNMKFLITFLNASVKNMDISA